jgi:hypothetical protein
MEHSVNAIDIGYSPPYYMFRRTLSNGLLPVEPYIPVYDMSGCSFLSVYPDSSFQTHSDLAVRGANPFVTKDVSFRISHDGLLFELTIVITDNPVIDGAAPARASG